MGLARPVIRTVVVMTLLVAVGYVLRPVAWELEAKLHDAKEILYRAGGRRSTGKAGVELPLATDENGLRKDTLEKIGSEESARLEQLKRKEVLTGEGGNLPGAKREASKQLIQVVDQGTQLADGLSRREKRKSGQVEDGDIGLEKEDGGESLLGRLTRRGAWRGIVEPYIGKPRVQLTGDGKRTTIADVESSNEEGSADEGDAGTSFEGGESATIGLVDTGEDESEEDVLELLVNQDETGPSEESNPRAAAKEGVKQFLAVNADLANGSADDEAVSGAAAAGGAVLKRGAKPKPREVAEEEGGLESDVSGEVDGWSGREGGVAQVTEGDEVEVAAFRESREANTGVNGSRGPPRIWVPRFKESDSEGAGNAGSQGGGLTVTQAALPIVSTTLGDVGTTLLENGTRGPPRIWRPKVFEGTQNESVSLGNETLQRDGLLNTQASPSNMSTSLQDAVMSPANGLLGLSDNSTEVISDNSTEESSDNSTEVMSDNSTEALSDETRPAEKSWPLVPEMRRQIWERPGAGSDMPAREEFTLRRELVEFWARDNTVVVTFANFAFLDFTTNWVRHLTDLNVDNILVGAMDEEILEALYFAGVPVFDMKSEMSTLDAGWGSPVFHKMGRERLYLVDALLKFGVELLMCDTDMVFLRDPLEYVRRYPQADVLTSSDHLVHTVGDEALERWQEAGAAYNIGIIHYRPTVTAKAFAREWLDVATKDDLVWDQNAFNDIMRRQLGPTTEDENGLFYAYDGKLKLGILPVSLFCSGHTYFVQKIYKTTGLQPFAIHTTFQYGGTDGKRHRLREGKVFYDEPEYYDPPGGLLAYKFDIPTEILSGGEHSLETHFALVNYQLLQLRNAFALAQTLNRTLVLPELWCRFDRLWYPHRGILEGTATPQPFLCPADHILEINKMVNGLPENQFGPEIRFREYSLLENPRLPKEVSESKVDVFICKAADASCKTSEVKEGLEKPKWVVLERDPSDTQVAAFLEPYRDTKLLHFSTMNGAFAGFEDKLLGDKFRARVKQYVGIWCCIEAHPGHIYYDMFWDEKPGWMPKPPKDPSEDHPPLRLS